MNITTMTTPRSHPSWSEQNAAGRAMAGELLDRIVAEDNPPLLGWALKEMVAKGEFSGVEVGFAQEIAERLMNRG